MSFVAELEPRIVWSHFDEILKIPRGSKKEDRIRDYVIGVAKRNNLEHQVDASGNVVVRKAGTAGHEKSPITVLQAHLDMVEQKNAGTVHDFDKDPIQPERDGAYLKAKGTTLGSDNGIGVASMLAVAESSNLRHGPLELLFTVDEETGLTGAAGLAGDMLEGRQLINVDSEEEGVLTIGCAGGADSHLCLELSEEPTPDGSRALHLDLSGLRGGHSGIDIHLQRGNATKLLIRAIYSLSLEQPTLLASLEGGTAHNAIPREATALLVLPGAGEADVAAARARLDSEVEAIRAELGTVDPGVECKIEQADAPARCWGRAATQRVLGLLSVLPHGVIAMSNDIEGLVETSTNFAVVKAGGGRATILMSTRSSVASALDALRRRIHATATLAGAAIEEDPGYPGWQPDVSSRLLELVKTQSEKVLGSKPQVGAVHAGLECGIIGEKYPGMDMISFGPQIEFPHSPDERVKIDTVGRFYDLLTTTLESLT